MRDLVGNFNAKIIESEAKQDSDLKDILKKNQKAFYNLFYNSKDITILFEVNSKGLPGNIIEVNDIACHKLGYTREEFFKISLESLGVDLDRSNTEKLKEDFFVEEYVSFKMSFLTKSDLVIPVEANVSSYIISGKKVILLVGRDITKRKTFEKRLVDNNEELKVALDELKMMQKQLVQQEKLAAIGQLAAGVAHEINNPLGYIYSNIETSRTYFDRYKNMINSYKEFIDSLSSIDSDELKSKIIEITDLEKRSGLDFISTDIDGLCDDVEDGLKKISEIVTSLKTFSRVDKPGILEKYDLNKGVKNTLMMARNEVKYHARVVEILNDVPLIRAMGNQIDQVLLNLILNAAHGIRAREINDLGLIIISTDVLDGYIICEIEDNGIGINEVNIKKIFDPFFTTKVTGQGTGLGLSIAYDIIVNKCDGEILVESIPNVKTKFTIKLPINSIDEDVL